MRKDFWVGLEVVVLSIVSVLEDEDVSMGWS